LALIWADIPQISGDVGAMIASSAGFWQREIAHRVSGSDRTSQMMALKTVLNAMLCLNQGASAALRA
jgi:hypothetical protein